MSNEEKAVARLFLYFLTYAPLLTEGALITNVSSVIESNKASPIWSKAANIDLEDMAWRLQELGWVEWKKENEEIKYKRTPAGAEMFRVLEKEWCTTGGYEKEAAVEVTVT